MVLQRESMLYQIDAFMEETLFISRFVAELICTTLAGSISLVNELLASLEAFVQWRLRANLSSFSEMVSQPQVLAWAWRLDAQRNEAEKGGTSTLKQGGSLHGLDDDRSLENRLSTLCVKRNVPRGCPKKPSNLSF